jgi:hypothetical protein
LPTSNDLLLVFLISLIGLFFLVVNAVLYVLKLSGKDKNYRILTAYLVVLSVEEVICNIMGIIKLNSNLFLNHFHFNIQFIFLSILFYRLFTNAVLKKMVIVILATVPLGLGIQYYSNPGLFWQFNVSEIAIISLILIFYSLIHLYNCLGAERRYFYFAIGLIMYLLCSSIIYMSGKYELVFLYKPYIDIWVFNSIFFITYQYLLFKEWKILNRNSTQHA